MKRTRCTLLFALLSCVLSLSANAASGRADYDLDDDGLIEINDLADLNDIRNSLDGKKLYTVSTGCPAAGCTGFELAADLNFDTNGDGKLDASDSYWADGAGWVAIGTQAAPFTATFEGNGRVIRNLFINRPSTVNQGLFGVSKGNALRNLGLTGKLMNITGSSSVGSLAGALNGATVSNCFTTGSVLAISSSSYAGGLVGQASGSNTITGSFTTGSVQALGNYAGGLLGFGSASFQSVFSSASVSALDYTGGLQGYGSSSTFTAAFAVGKVASLAGNYVGAITGLWGSSTNVYYATDASGQTSQGQGSSGAKGVTLAQLKCPTAADNTTCISGNNNTLYVGWGALKDTKGANYWDFGTNSQLPGLVLNGVVYRDSDGDGYLDADDVWPTNYAAAVDSDGDGAPDKWSLGCDTACQTASGLVLDQVPNSAAAVVDGDLDGRPDAWPATCNSTCQTASGLILDARPNDADNDGVIDTSDNDINNDGVPDADLNHNGLIEVSTWAQLNAVRNNLSGAGRQLAAAGAVDSSGCPVGVSQGAAKRVCNGYELTQDLNFDTNSDGKLNVDDSYWNMGSGWVAIGTQNAPFSAIFEGNGFIIRNLMINRPLEAFQGLFGTTRNASLRNLGLMGSLQSISGESYVGGLVGWALNTQVVNGFTAGTVIGEGNIGGLIGVMDSTSSVTGGFSAGAVQSGGDYVGGLIGNAGGVTLNSVFSSASVIGKDYIGALVGYGYSAKVTAAYATGKVSSLSPYQGGLSGDGGDFKASYWAQDTTAQLTAGGSISATFPSTTLAQLKCPTAADNTSCVTNTTLYVGWGALTDTKGNNYWNFGANTDLPGLVLNGVVYRDNDADGVLDADDKWPVNPAAGIDSDNDGAPDRWSASCDSACQTASGLILDQFPTNSAAAVDLDLDGKPDAWNAACIVACQNTSGLVLDANLNDSDNDGIVDNTDTDINSDGAVDADKDHDGLIEVSSLAQLDAMRYNPAGKGRQLTSDGTPDASGCGAHIVQGTLQRVCEGYELTQSLDFDTNADGKLDASDTYWNSGSGWLPIDTFSAIFDGNGYLIRNLMINRATNNNVGLWGMTSGATLRNVGLTGKLMSLTGNYNLGALVGNATQTKVENVFSTGVVVSAYDGSAYVGGLVGYFKGGSLVGSFTTGNVQAKNGSYVAGLVGYASNVSLASVFSSASVTGAGYVGGILGYASDSPINAAYVVGRISAINNSQALSSDDTTNSYWANDWITSVSDASGATAATSAQLKCPTAADNTSCVSGTTLYTGWGALKDRQANNYWSFGTNTQLPGLVLNGVTYRDNDGDGYLDSEDVLPNNGAAGLDADGDGAPDQWAQGCDSACQAASGLVLDQFPVTAAASVDLDLDGKPDAWNSGCNAACQTASGLVLDTKPNDVDNDGVLDTVDTDINGDGIIDADANHNGLIEISTLAQLDVVRYNLAGTGRKLSADAAIDSSGCGVQMINGVLKRACIGYELTQDLDFDTNTDGKLDASDSYWNTGLGWLAIGDSNNRFSAVLEGNGYVIRNLMINRPTANYQGLLASTRSASIRNLGLTGKLMTITGSSYVGGLVGYSYTTDITNSFSTGTLVASSTSSAYAGGLVGIYNGGTMIASFTTGRVQANTSYVGGLIGAGYGTFRAVFSSASVSGGDYVGGLVGQGNDANFRAAYAVGRVTSRGSYAGGISGLWGNAAQTYWAVDATGRSSQGTGLSGAAGFSLAQLKCPTAADNATCAMPSTLYEAWADYKDAKGNAYWNFGSATQLPGLVLNGQVYRDGDGDGYLDADDVWPTEYAAAVDSDLDGAPDYWTAACNSACQVASGLVLDQFPNKAAASVDADLDGKPDAWNANCNTACQTASGLVLDTLPNDGDNDGVSDSADTDTNGDGVTDADADHNGLLEITTWAQLDAVRYNLAGTGRQLSAAAVADSSGCPVTVNNGVAQRLCNGYELSKDLDFDTNTDGKLDASDTYWNGGLGWVAIGTQAQPFKAVFEGNNHVIRNLMINRPSTSYQGLFGSANGAVLRNVGINGALTRIAAASYVGGLGGALDNSVISNCFVAGAVAGTTYVGGLAGQVNKSGGSTAVSEIIGSFTTGSVLATGNYAGGLGGYIQSTKVTAVFSTATVTGANNVGGVAGYGNVATFIGMYATGKVTASGSSVGGVVGLWGTISAAHWATDATGQNLIGQGVSTGTSVNRGVTLEQLKCPTAANNTTCVSGATLYAGWGDLKDDKGNAYWDFGNASQLPALVLNGVIQRDTDGDGLFDMDDPDIDNDGVPNAQDQLPTNAAASVDTDGDGSPDSWNAACNSACQASSGLTLDAWPSKAAASKDADGDGFPDAWSTGCNAACQTASGLTLDAFPALVSVSLDADADGVPDAWNTNCDAVCKTAAQAAMVRLDQFPSKVAASLDTDGDGFPDSWNAGCNAACQNASGLKVDAFPSNAAASLDSDADGFPDAWNTGCNTACQTASGLKLDAVPNNIAASVDSDSDGSPDAWNTNCNASCQAASGLMLDAFPNNAAASVDTDGDGSPDSWKAGCDSTCQAASGLKLDAFPTKVAASVDSDGDGSPDAWNSGCLSSCQVLSGLKLDAFPTNAAASLDSDGDGFPDAWSSSCNSTCQAASGLKLDALPNSAAASVDSDGDGSPEAWNANCNAACQTNSGLTLDAFPSKAAASVDSDGDGSPDAWNASCNTACQTGSGLKLDAFPKSAAASVDADGDGRPDVWAASCDSACQTASGLTLDKLLNDKDNDGVADSLDTDNTKDNGKPLLTAIPANMSVAATGALTWVTLAKADVVASDAVDSTLAFEVSLPTGVLTFNENNQVALPSGVQSVSWVAIDKAGNRSEPMVQTIKVYPQAQFSQQTFTVGENIAAKLPISFVGAVPEYPITLTFTWVSSESTGVLADINTSASGGVDVNKLSLTIKSAAELAGAALVVPIAGDSLVESDETLVFELSSATAGTDTTFAMPIDDAKKRITLTLTEANLAPSVSLKMVQAGKETLVIDPAAGQVTATATVTDLNGSDKHSYVWTVGSLPVAPSNQNSYSFDPAKLAQGMYSITLKVTDNGVPPLTSEQAGIEFKVAVPVVSSSSSSKSSASSSSKSSTGTGVNSSAATSASSSTSTETPAKSGGGGGGSASWLLLLLLAGFGFLPKRKAA